MEGVHRVDCVSMETLAAARVIRASGSVVPWMVGRATTSPFDGDLYEIGGAIFLVKKGRMGCVGT